MNLLVQGKHAKVIAMELSLSPKTIEHHRVNILKKMRSRQRRRTGADRVDVVIQT